MAILGSGSGGNASVVWGSCGPILIDAGLSGRQLIQRLDSLGLQPSDLQAILLTHEHGDHTRGLDVLSRKAPDVPVCCTSHTRTIIRNVAARSVKNWRYLEADSRAEFAGLVIDSFTVPHDAVDPVGFVIQDRESGCRLGYATDLGHVPHAIAGRLSELDALFVEANYCPQLLASDSKRPWGVKQRIAGRHGHLSNQQVGELIMNMDCQRLKHLVLGHLSSDCNSQSAVEASLRPVLETLGLGASISLHCATQDQILGPLVLEAPAPPLVAAAAVHQTWMQLDLFEV